MAPAAVTGCVSAPSRWMKLLGVLYPTLTLLAITITGNHYIVDALVGIVVALTAIGTVRLLYWLRSDRGWHNSGPALS